MTMGLSPGTPRSMIADPTRLRQILLNLLGNAIKFAAQGTVGLRIAAAGNRLRIEVADTGPGIPAERRNHLFQDFERLGAEADAAEGAGLGAHACVPLTSPAVQKMVLPSRSRR